MAAGPPARGWSRRSGFGRLPSGHRTAVSDDRSRRRLRWADVPLGLHRLVIPSASGLLVIPAIVLDSAALCAVAATIVLVSALLARDSLRSRSRGSVLAPCLHGTLVAAMIAIIAAKVGWSLAAALAGAAALLFLLQLVPALAGRGPSDRQRLEQLRREVAERAGDDGGSR